MASEGIGWVVASQEALCELLVRLHDQRSLVTDQQRQLAVVRQRHTWLARPQTVAELLTTYRRSAARC